MHYISVFIFFIGIYNCKGVNMAINFFLKNNKLKNIREQYIKECRVDEIKIEPCGKFVACLEKLSKNYVLALKDNANIETLQVVNQNDIEFYEGYEISPSLTDDLRKKVCLLTRKIYCNIKSIIEMLNKLERDLNENKYVVNDIKLDFNVMSDIFINIYQHLTMTDEVPTCGLEKQDDLKNVLENLRSLILDTLKEIIELNTKIIINYITRQLDVIMEKILLYYNQLANILKNNH